MKKIIALVFILSFFAGNVMYAGNENESGKSPANTTIIGKVFDKNTMEELVGVTVQIEGTDIKAYTDIEGNFKIEGVQPGTYNLNISYISYKEAELTNVSIEQSSGKELEIKLEQIN
jgi:hypothetical protein